MRFVTWDVRSLISVARELASYALDLLGLQEVRWDKGDSVRAGDCFFLMENETKFIQWEEDFFGRFVSNRMSYIVLRGR